MPGGAGAPRWRLPPGSTSSNAEFQAVIEGAVTITTSASRPRLRSLIAAGASVCWGLIVWVAPSSTALPRRQSERSNAITWPTPNRGAMWTNPSPMNPAPTTATVSPGWIRHCLSPPSTHDHGSMVVATSSAMVSGSLWTSARRWAALTRKYSAMAPGSSRFCLKTGSLVKRPRTPQWEFIRPTWWLTNTLSPISRPVTSRPRSATNPTGSWPRIFPPSFREYQSMASLAHREVASVLTSISSSAISGTGATSTRMSPGP